MRSASYWRASKNWHLWLGKIGRVELSTQIRVSAPQMEELTPYSYAVVSFGKKRKEFMGVTGEKLQSGDKVVCVLRKLSIGSAASLIEYGIKVKKYD